MSLRRMRARATRLSPYTSLCCRTSRWCPPFMRRYETKLIRGMSRSRVISSLPDDFFRILSEKTAHFFLILHGKNACPGIEMGGGRMGFGMGAELRSRNGMEKQEKILGFRFQPVFLHIE